MSAFVPRAAEGELRDDSATYLDPNPTRLPMRR
jgi:hypothetical protein